jgi:RluA family pseudouridine synthase
VPEDPPPLTTCPVLHDDGCVICLNKPAGVLSHPNTRGGDVRSAFSGSYDPDTRRFDTAAGPVWLIHRLDQDTSGVLLAARKESAAQSLRAAFEQGRIRKHYLALLCGNPPPRGVWKDFLEPGRQGSKIRTALVPGRKPNAELRYHTLQSIRPAGISLVEIDLITGKTHQIRVQAAARRHPVAGDDIYGDFTLNRRLRKAVGVRRLMLHAAALELPHPLTGKSLTVTAAPPADFLEALRSLGMRPPGGRGSS